MTAAHERHRRSRHGAVRRDDGNAVVEFVFVAVLVLVPLVYLVVTIARLQQSRLAVTSAARDAGRAIVDAGPGLDPDAAARTAVRIALAGQHLAPSEVELRYVAAGADCSSAPIPPVVEPGAEFTVCVTRHDQLPGIPAIVGGRGVTTVGRYLVHVNDFAAPH